MNSPRSSIRRPLSHEPVATPVDGVQPARFDAPRLVRRTVIDFSSLSLPEDVRLALAQAFWSHCGARSPRGIKSSWSTVLTFNRFAVESGAVSSLASLDRQLLVRYIEWLNAQRRADGTPWAISTRASTYGALRQLLRWLERCRPDLVDRIEHPFTPFPGRGSDRPRRATLTARELRAILQACEVEIAALRQLRASAAEQRAADGDKPGSLGWLLAEVDRRFHGIVPSKLELDRRGNHRMQAAVRRWGGAKQIEPFLYPRAVSLLPYYLAILIHAAGNPEPIVELGRDCLQDVPLLENRQALVWFKARAGRLQRRTFERNAPFEPPALVRDILAWNERLRPLAPPAQRDRLFIFKGLRTVNAMSTITVHHLLSQFCERHGLPAFALASIRPSVLCSFYRATGDLVRTRAVANHANVATTVRYVEAPVVRRHNHMRIAALQEAFLEHLTAAPNTPTPQAAAVAAPSALPPGELVSMFGFDCRDPLAGTAPGTRPGELCTNFMGCFTCPNAVITPAPLTMARLLQARDHLRAAAATLHPARWQAFYAPQLRILEEDILPRFSARELAAADLLMPRLPPLPDLR
ncbi:MAG TPA: hypothetical protein VFQ16_00485 [Burkholderiaceae bacterium]|jgi:hypothetical protein|uniref:hypothetical protein n=1 Tax=Piscinibacter TaxID=1114981 RepID=UPI000FDDC786|nr:MULTISPECIES: hypothetical protein [Piscinibacter]MBP6029734.1 hypothetical protein [Piscinibacter sp.]HET9820277.1 hypothetical protein [Burkholderiaceae bacterium]HOX69514.1 hypothetical protein [Burkholderiaceae bacterium]